jgi:4-hydroxybenzoate polyprenyltransferase
MGYERHDRPASSAPPRWRQRLSLYWALVRGDRPVGWLLLLWPTWWGLWLAAGGMPPLWILVVFSLGVWLTRSAGCVINDYADRWLDPQVERTRDRPLATGAMSGREALALFAVLMLAALALVLTLNRLTVLLSLVGVLLAASYPYLKRHTYLPQVYLGLAFGWGIPMAFAAVQGAVPPLAWMLYVANIFWATGYDTWYAMVDRDDDLRAGAKSTAILFGELDLVAQGVLYSLFLAALALVGRQAALGLPYWSALGIAALLVVYEFALARHRDRDACFRAFRHNHWIGAVVFAGIALDYALQSTPAS